MAQDAEIRDFVCTACGCMCDDLVLSVADNRITAIAPPCQVAEQFFIDEQESAFADAPINVQEAVQRAAGMLRAARAPLVMGFERATVDAQRAAVEIAESTGAFIDPTDEHGFSRSHVAEQTVGAVTATLGEVAQRADLVVYWECDESGYPRHRERFARREGQRVVTVDPDDGIYGEQADLWLLIRRYAGVECASTVRALVRNIEVDAQRVRAVTGESLDKWRQLVALLKSAKYIAFFYPVDRLGLAPVDHVGRRRDQHVSALFELVRDLHRFTRAVALPLGGRPNEAGAQQVLTWQTGFPAAVSFARGYPQYLPGEAMAARLLERGEVDAALIIGADPLASLSKAAASHLLTIPTVVLDDRPTATFEAATVAIPTSRFGMHTTGSVYRSDGVVLPLRAALPTQLPHADEVLKRLAAALAD